MDAGTRPGHKAALEDCLDTAMLPYEVPRELFCECYVDEVSSISHRAFCLMTFNETSEMSKRALIMECTASAYEQGQRRPDKPPHP